MSARRKNKFKVKRYKRNGDLRKATGDHESNASSDRYMRSAYLMESQVTWQRGRIRCKGRSLFSRPFACICIYNVISVVHQKIGLLIKLFVVVVWKKNTGKLQMKRIGFSDKRSHRIKEWAETNQARNQGGCMGCIRTPPPTGPKGPHFDTQYPS